MMRYGPNIDLKNSTNYLKQEYEKMIEEQESLENVSSKVKQKSLWKTLIQRNIEYCSQLFLPNKATELQLIENLKKCQKNTKFLNASRIMFHISQNPKIGFFSIFLLFNFSIFRSYFRFDILFK